MKDSDQNLSEQAMREAVAGESLAARGQYREARQHFHEAAQLQPEEARFQMAIGMCEWKLGRLDNAGPYFLTAICLNPQWADAHAALANWYLGQDAIELALDASARSLELAPANNDALLARARALEAASDTEDAWNLVQQMIDAGHRSPPVVCLYGRMARRRDHLQKAMELVGGQLADAANASDAELHFTAAELLEEIECYDEAFAHVAMGNALRAKPYDPAINQRMFDGLISYFTPARLHSLPNAMYRSSKPVFVLGMPRSGTTLVEQILASHPQVHGAGELDFLRRVILGAINMTSKTETNYPHCLNSLSLDQIDGLAQIYIDPLIWLNPQATKIIDKMPLNFLHLGFISILLPEAKIVHCRRDPMDTCLSCFFTDFYTGNEFKNNLTHLGMYYRQYEQLMAHWKKLLNLPILDVSYEEIVADPEGQSRRMIEFLGLPWDERCLKFHETKRLVTTASIRQVRKPIYKTSVQRWRNYEKHLGPLKDALGL